MPVAFNHTIAHARDSAASARFLATLLGLQAPARFGPFWTVELCNGVSLDFLDAGDSPINPQHYAFLIEERDFDPIFERILDAGLDHWADPHKQQPGQINHRDGGRGVYFEDPDGHLLEILTRPYGSGPASG